MKIYIFSHFETVVAVTTTMTAVTMIGIRVKSTREVSAMLRIRILSDPNTVVAGFVFQMRPRCDKL